MAVWQYESLMAAAVVVLAIFRFARAVASLQEISQSFEKEIPFRGHRAF